MANTNKEVIDVLNNLIVYSKDGEKGFQDSADHVSNSELKSFFVRRAKNCTDAIAELQAEVTRLGGEPADSASFIGELHRGWVNLQAMVVGKDDDAVLTEVERGEDYALAAYKDAREKLVTLGKTALDSTYALVEKQLHGVQMTDDQVKHLRQKTKS